MDRLYKKCLASPTIRAFVSRRQPEGKLPPDAFENAITYSYQGSQTAHFVKAPCTKETLIPHLCTEGVILGETLGLEQQHPILPLLRMVSKGALKCSTTVVARRFVISLNIENVLDILEFSWLDDGRLLLTYRCTDLGKCFTWAHYFESGLYKPASQVEKERANSKSHASQLHACGDSDEDPSSSDDLQVNNAFDEEFPSELEFKLKLRDPKPTRCELCEWKNVRPCECSPALRKRRRSKLTSPSRKITPRSWSDYSHLFYQLNRIGHVDVQYFDVVNTPLYGRQQRLVHSGQIVYRLGVLQRFGDQETRERQLQVYSKASGSLISSPSTDRFLLHSYHDSRDAPDVLAQFSHGYGAEQLYEIDEEDQKAIVASDKVVENETHSLEEEDGARILKRKRLSESPEKERPLVVKNFGSSCAAQYLGQVKGDPTSSPSSSTSRKSSEECRHICRPCRISFPDKALYLE